MICGPDCGLKRSINPLQEQRKMDSLLCAGLFCLKKDMHLSSSCGLSCLNLSPMKYRLAVHLSVPLSYDASKSPKKDQDDQIVAFSMFLIFLGMFQ